MTATTSSVTLDTQVRRSDEALFQEIGGEAVLLDLASEHYFGLDPVGTRIWTLLHDHQNLQAVFDRLCSEYDADPQRIRADLLALVDQMAGAGLVKVG